VAYVIKGEIPVWANEGLAEYFGEAVFTGDGFVSGTLPPRRIRQVQKELEKMKDLQDLIQMNSAQWSAEMETSAHLNYDQVWSLVYFLVHAENGKYCKPFIGFINSCARGVKGEAAWKENFGTDFASAQKQWMKFWSELRIDAGADTQTRITVATLTSFLARAALQKQTFPTAEAFFKAAQAGQLKCGNDEWLPPSLLARSLNDAVKVNGWSIETPSEGHPSLVLKADNGKTFTGKYSNTETRVTKVVVAVNDKVVATKSATSPSPVIGAKSAPAAQSEISAQTASSAQAETP
jgi:hypothetical protein